MSPAPRHHLVPVCPELAGTTYLITTVLPAQGKPRATHARSSAAPDPWQDKRDADSTAGTQRPSGSIQAVEPRLGWAWACAMPSWAKASWHSPASGGPWTSCPAAALLSLAWPR